MGFLRFIAKRLALTIGVLFGVSVVIFTLSRGFPTKYPPWVEYLPGLGSNSNPNLIAEIKAAHGFNLPLYLQYFYWLRDTIQGNWGISHWAGDLSTFSIFANRFPLTAELAVSSVIITLAFGIPLGILAATRTGKWPDIIARVVSISGYSLPIFWLGYLLQLTFSYYFKIWHLPFLPSSGAVDTQFVSSVHRITGVPIIDAVLEGNLPYFDSALTHLILPAVTLSIALLGYVTRTVRSSMLEVLKQDYIILAKSKGLSERVVLYRHALRNALIPTITIMGLLFAFTLGGVVVIEYVFSWPGVGWAALQATFENDSNFLMLYTIVSAAIICGCNLVVDVAYGVLDPRIRLK